MNYKQLAVILVLLCVTFPVFANPKQLFTALQQNKEKAALQVLAKIKDPNITERYTGMTPLHYAVRNASISLVKALLAKNASVRSVDKENRTALHFVFIRRNLFDKQKTVHHYLLTKAQKEKDYLKIINLLLARGADLQAMDKRGRMPIFPVVVAGFSNIYQIYLQKQAKTNIIDKQGNTLLHALAEELRWGMRAGSDAIENINDWQIRRYSEKKARLSIGKSLIKKGIDVNQKNQSGLTALHYAALGSPEIIRLLLKQGAIIDSRDNQNRPALHLSCRSGNLPTTAFLIQSGAIRSLKTHEKANILFGAIRSSELELVKYLLQKGFHLKEMNERGETVVHAASRSSLPVLNYVVNRVETEYINRVSKDKKTALDMVSQYHKKRIVLLRSRGAKYYRELHKQISDKPIEQNIEQQMRSLYISPQKPTPAPYFQLKNRQGQKITLTSLKGKIVFINFWATWCGPCVHEMPSIEKLHQVSKGKGFMVITLSNDSKQKLDSFMKRGRYTFPVLQGIPYQYKVRGYPTSLILNKKGEVIAKALGGRNWASARMIQLFENLAK